MCLRGGDQHELTSNQHKLGQGTPFAHSQERQTERLTEHTVLTGPRPELFSLFIHTAVCLLKEKGQLSSSPERKQKSQQTLTGTDRGLSDKMDALEIEGGKHNVVYIWRGKAAGVSVVAHVHKAHHTRLRTEQDFVCVGGGCGWLKGCVTGHTNA